jgi:hypothetical protein
MAQQVNVKFVDDLDGSDAAGTVSFGLDGRVYEIDLSDDNAARLRDSLASFIAAARKSGGSTTTGSRRAQKMTVSSGPRPQTLDREQTAAIRVGPAERPPDLRPRPHLQDSRGRLPGRPLTQTTRGGRGFRSRLLLVGPGDRPRCIGRSGC